MPIKIFGELEEKVKKLVEDGYRSQYIEHQTGLSWGTIVSWCKRNGLTLGLYRNPELKAKEIRLVSLLKSGMIMKHACKEVNICDGTGVQWAKRNGLGHLLRSRADSAKDKRISMEEMKSRLPAGHGEIISYDSKNKLFLIKREDGTTYNRIRSQVFRGDPKKSENCRINEQEAADYLSGLGYKLLEGTFRIKREPLFAQHIKCGYVRQNILANFTKQDCPRCSNTGTSKEEKSLDMWIKSLGIDSQKFRFQNDYAGKGKGKEIDIYIPENKLGIEYCGFYHHGEKRTLHALATKIKRYNERGEVYQETKFDSPKWKHWAKMDKANNLGIELLTIFEHEWKKSSEKVEFALKAKLGKNEIRINARDTQIKQLSEEQSNNFLKLYDLRGTTKSTISFGIFHNEELVGLIVGGPHGILSDKLIINRICFKGNTSVIGGAEKLTQELENWAKSKGHKEIFAWSDNKWGRGGIYENLGYSFYEDVEPDYFYFDGAGKSYPKENCKEEHLYLMGATGNTEWEMAQSLGYDRIYDCGQKIWIKKL
jgi:hypothetical protein